MRASFKVSLAVAALAAVAGTWLATGAAQSATTRSPREAFQQECGACHWAYVPELLPARSWQAITSDLSHHFGQNASLDTATTTQIIGYLVGHAADAPGSNHSFMRGLNAGDSPRRVTDTPLWRAIHGEVNPRTFARSDIKTKANCMACHRG